MLLHKHYHILKQFLGNYRKEIYGRELIKKIPLSQKAIALTLRELEGILLPKKTGNIRFYSLNLKHPDIRNILAITELMKKIEFFRRHRTLSELFRRDDRIVLIYGSYAKGLQRKGSDLDLMIIGKKRINDYNGKPYDINIDIKYLTEKECKHLIKKDNLLREVIENPIVVFNTERFINLLWEDYYGFD